MNISFIPVIPRRVLALGIVVLVSLSLCLLVVFKGWVKANTLNMIVEQMGGWGMLVYILGQAIMEFFWLPRMWGLLAGGILFGPFNGGLLSILGDLLGGWLCYEIARRGGRAWVSTVLQRRPNAKQIVNMLAEHRGALSIFLLRNCPVAHYTLVSYAAGLSGVRRRAFLLGTGVGLVPGAIIYPLAGHSSLNPTSWSFLISVSIMVIFLITTIIVGRKLIKPSQPQVTSKSVYEKRN